MRTYRGVCERVAERLRLCGVDARVARLMYPPLHCLLEIGHLLQAQAAW